MLLTLRPDPRGAAHHYRIFDDDRYVGRVYRAEGQWFWSLAFDVTAPSNPPNGHEPSRDAAMLKFKIECEKWKSG
jgi:hypothetical protein